VAHLAFTAYISLFNDIKEDKFKEPKTYQEAINSSEKDL
jgi:hypothetical protein